jgi:(1->4)-alpha-D-glucan 1-alpha-D-glucosylmutase
MSRRVPGATYRLQLHEGFTLDSAAQIVDYLAELGVTHVYCSPILQAVPHSTHGYDIVDHSRINSELGGRAAFDRFSAACRQHGLGIVLDIVPNHMAVNDPGNAQWWDVLKRGRTSEYAAWFDIDWDAPQSHGQVLLPLLGDEVERLVAAGEIRLETHAGQPVLRYYDAIFPVAEGTGHGGVESILARQHYRLAHWRERRSPNYRRFFDVTSLAGLRVEDEAVFDATHRVILSLIESGQVDGLRVDHPDGLADPAGYLERLRQRAPGTWIVVEKILEPGEELDPGWPIDGTTGYDALHDVSAVFVDPDAAQVMDDLCAEITGDRAVWDELVHDAKLDAIDRVLTAELDFLTRLSRAPIDSASARAALRELLASFPYYRTYFVTGEEPHPADREHFEAARDAAISRRPDLAGAIRAVADEIADVKVESELRVRFQQSSGPVMAKGVEDTAFYRYHRLVSLNEVGGDPHLFGSSVEEFHAACAARLAEWPHSMTLLSTHDTKRSEDVRARLSLLPQITDIWAVAVRRWVADNDRHWSVDADRAIEYFVYQTLMGAWPISADRACSYADKASREAKVRTSWIDPDPSYDAALHAFVSTLCDDSDFVADLEAFVSPLLWPGRIASLAQKLVQLTIPGVPDVYQGTELWDLSLVDPDNRRPVDYAERRRLLELLAGCSLRQVLTRADEGLPKLLVVQKALAVRKRLPDVFRSGSYEPLEVSGPGGGSVIAFARGGRAATVVPRFPLRDGDWDVTRVTLPPGEWHNEFTGKVALGSVAVAELFAEFPVALLSRA